MDIKKIIKQPFSGLTYAMLSFVALLIGIYLVSLFIDKANDLIASGIDKMIFYVILIPLGLSTAAFLFGAMRSYAVCSGKSFGGKIELGGPAAIFALVIVGGFYLVPDIATLNITVFVHGSGGKQEIVLRNQGEVIIDFDDKRWIESIRENGQAIFQDVPVEYRNRVVPILVQAKGFELADKKKQYKICDKGIYVEVKRDTIIPRNNINKPQMVNIKLIVNSRFSNAKISIDDLDAKVVNNSPIVKIIKVELNKTHKIKLVEGENKSDQTVLITSANQVIIVE